VEEVQDYWRGRAEKFGDSWSSSFWTEPDLIKKVDDLQMRSLRQYINQIEPCHKVLDVGCGVGRFSLRFAKRDAQIYGIDTAEAVIKILQKKGIPNTRFEVMDARDLKFEDETFDWIFSITVLQHITAIRGLFRAIKEILRVLRTGGRAILLESTTDMRGDRNVISLPRSAWVKMIEKAGGKIETVEKIDYPMKGWEGWYTLFCITKNKPEKPLS
jgi:ubiquinone/menaquinone biosynthesis C-methylase UbiE